MRLLTEQEIADRIRDAFGQYPVSDVALEAICHNLQNAYEGYIIVDDRNRLLFLSEANERFFSVAGSRPFLRPNSEINPTSRLDQVIRTGKSEVGDVAEFPGGHIRIVSRFPIVRDGKVIGAYGKVIFANVGRLNQVMREIDELRSRLKVAEEELSTLKSTRFSRTDSWVKPRDPDSEGDGATGLSKQCLRPVDWGNRHREGNVRVCHALQLS